MGHVELSFSSLAHSECRTAQSTADGGLGVWSLRWEGAVQDVEGEVWQEGRWVCGKLGLSESGGGQQGSTGQCSVELRVRRMSLGEEESHVASGQDVRSGLLILNTLTGEGALSIHRVLRTRTLTLPKPCEISSSFNTCLGHLSVV